MGLTARGKDADKFWFSLFHKFAHIVLCHVGQQPDGISDEEEKATYKRSADTLIPADDFERFRKGRDFSERNIIDFAEKQGIALGIIVGRMQIEGMIKYNMLNNLKGKYEIPV